MTCAMPVVKKIMSVHYTAVNHEGLRGPASLEAPPRESLGRRTDAEKHSERHVNGPSSLVA